MSKRIPKKRKNLHPPIESLKRLRPSIDVIKLEKLSNYDLEKIMEKMQLGSLIRCQMTSKRLQKVSEGLNDLPRLINAQLRIMTDCRKRITSFTVIIHRQKRAKAVWTYMFEKEVEQFLKCCRFVKFKEVLIANVMEGKPIGNIPTFLDGRLIHSKILDFHDATENILRLFSFDKFVGLSLSVLPILKSSSKLMKCKEVILFLRRTEFGKPFCSPEEYKFIRELENDIGHPPITLYFTR